MPFLIDGNNLIHALREVDIEVGRGGLCRLLGRFAAEGSTGPKRAASRVGPVPPEKVRVVFDGPPPYGPLAKQIEDDRIDVKYASGRTADDIIVEYIAADSAPRRLTVVSTDREIRKAARSRRCKIKTSEDFARTLVEMLAKPAKSRSTEPPEKRVGLTPEQTRAWLRDLKIEDEDSEVKTEKEDEEQEEDLL